VYLHLGARRDEPPRRLAGRPVAEVDPDQAAALRRLRAAFGFVEVLRIVDHDQDQDQDDDPPTEEGELGPPADRERQGAGGVSRRYTTRWRWFG
jgi:hypothetical protein